MTTVDPFVPILHVLKDVVSWLKAVRVPGAVVGGVAASLLGRPRMTQDVDILVSIEEQKWPSFVDAGARFGIEPRIADAVEFARRSRVLTQRTVICQGPLAFRQTTTTSKEK